MIKAAITFFILSIAHADPQIIEKDAVKPNYYRPIVVNSYVFEGGHENVTWTRAFRKSNDGGIAPLFLAVLPLSVGNYTLVDAEFKTQLVEAFGLCLIAYGENGKLVTLTEGTLEGNLFSLNLYLINIANKDYDKFDKVYEFCHTRGSTSSKSSSVTSELPVTKTVLLKQFQIETK